MKNMVTKAGMKFAVLMLHLYLTDKCILLIIT